MAAPSPLGAGLTRCLGLEHNKAQPFFRHALTFVGGATLRVFRIPVFANSSASFHPLNVRFLTGLRITGFKHWLLILLLEWPCICPQSVPLPALILLPVYPVWRHDRAAGPSRCFFCTCLCPA